ncbi:MAG: ATP-binding protein, partial [Planctomycetota bacterium]
GGIGIRAAERARVFEPFVRAETALATGRVGGGLGLAIARQIVRDHGGRIEHHPARPRGTLFSVRLPAAAATPACAPAAPEGTS